MKIQKCPRTVTGKHHYASDTGPDAELDHVYVFDRIPDYNINKTTEVYYLTCIFCGMIDDRKKYKTKAE